MSYDPYREHPHDTGQNVHYVYANNNAQHASYITQRQTQQQHSFYNEYPGAASSVANLTYDGLSNTRKSKSPPLDPELEALVKLLNEGSDAIIYRYLPCTEFLVQCQQDLRAGLETFNHRAGGRSYKRGYDKSSVEFYSTYIHPLPTNFQHKNASRIPEQYLSAAVSDLVKLCHDAEPKSRGTQCSAVKDAFLGGMKEGESWGLRRWMSKHGGALKACNDLEDVLQKVQKMDRESPRTVRLGKIVRKITTHALTRLHEDIPKAYQEVSSAHPYLPFFHRLESVLQGLSWFDPEDDDVICLDSDEVEKEKLKQVERKKSSAERMLHNNSGQDVHHVYQPSAAEDIVNIDDEDDSSNTPISTSTYTNNKTSKLTNTEGSTTASACTTEQNANVAHIGQWSCSICTFVNEQETDRCVICDKERPFSNGNDASSASKINGNTINGTLEAENSKYSDGNNGLRLERARKTSEDFVSRIEVLDFGDRSSSASYWDQSWEVVMNLVCRTIRAQYSSWILEFDENQVNVVRHPLCLRDIVDALTNIRGHGRLVRTKLNWSVYNMEQLLEAVDLVMINALVTNGPAKTNLYNDVRHIRQYFWQFLRDHAKKRDGVGDILPTKRSERSKFVLLCK